MAVYCWRKLASLVFFLDELLCDLLAGKQQITTKCRSLYKFISKSLSFIGCNYILYIAGKFIHQCVLVITGRERLVMNI